MKLEWKINNDSVANIGFTVSKTVLSIANNQMPDLADYFPFRGRWKIDGHFDKDWMAFRIVNLHGSGIPAVGKLKDNEIDYLKSKSLPPLSHCHLDLCKMLGNEWFSFDCFTYLGPYSNSYACWPDLNKHLVDWLNNLVLPEVTLRNQTRVLRAIPSPPKFDTSAIYNSCWVLECEESCRQGTAFYVEDVGLVTCQHVLGPKTHAFHPRDITKKYPVEVVEQNETIDLAILRIEQIPDRGLPLGTADDLRQMDHIAVTGFPNYRLGDTGVIIPGLIVGFRMVSAIRRILTNAPIVAGNSGGPVLASQNKVVGVAVTGADRMEDATNTENHGVIPIDALAFLIKDHKHLA